MNDDIFRPEGADWVEPARPPVEPMVNVSATDGFAVDGTDGFAIDERPTPMPVEAPATDSDEAPALSRGRLVATVGAALTGLLVVILVGSSTGPRPVVSEAGVLRTDDGVTTTTEPGGSTPEGAWTSLLGLWGSSAFAPVYEFDGSDEFATEYYTTDPYGTTYPTEYETDFDSQFDSQFDTQFDTGFDESSTFTYNTLPPRRLPVFTSPSSSRFVPPRPIPTTTTTTTTTAPTTTTAESTTTTLATTTTTATTATTAPPPPVAVSGVSELPLECGSGLRVWRRQETLLASLDGRGLFASTNGGAAWNELGAATEGTGSHGALVRDPANPDAFWVAGAGGVFKTTNGGVGFVNLGGQIDVRSISIGIVSPGAGLMLAGTGDASTLRRSVDDGVTWSDITDRLPAGVGAIRHPFVLDSSLALVGTSTGVYRTVDGGQNWTPSPVRPGDVVGAPVRATDKSITWLLPDATGVIRSVDAGATWTQTQPKVPNTISPTATSLILAPNGDLVTEGVNGDLIASSDGGSTWRTFGPACPANRPT